jgi:hypothetical protein
MDRHRKSDGKYKYIRYSTDQPTDRQFYKRTYWLDPDWTKANDVLVVVVLALYLYRLDFVLVIMPGIIWNVHNDSRTIVLGVLLANQ